MRCLVFDAVIQANARGTTVFLKDYMELLLVRPVRVSSTQQYYVLQLYTHVMELFLGSELE